MAQITSKTSLEAQPQAFHLIYHGNKITDIVKSLAHAIIVYWNSAPVEIPWTYCSFNIDGTNELLNFRHFI